MKSHKEKDLDEKYPGVKKYCKLLLVLEIKESSFKDIDEEIKQRLSGI